MISPHLPVRNPTVPLSATTRFDSDRFTGAWEVVSCVDSCVDIRAVRAGADGTLVLEIGEKQIAYEVTSPGVLSNAELDQTLVVMWVDEGFRTAVVGDAEGFWAVILDRNRPGGADRVQAATEILEFNGWDVSLLQRVGG